MLEYREQTWKENKKNQSKFLCTYPTFAFVSVQDETEKKTFDDDDDDNDMISYKI